MTHWIGIGMLGVSIPLFFAARRRGGFQTRPYNDANLLVRRIVHGGIFLMGLLGVFLALFGSFERAGAAILIWIACAWALNR